MEGKEAILKRIRRNKPALSPLPELTIDAADYTKDQLISEFKKNLRLAGAAVVEVNDPAEYASFIKTNYPQAVDFEIRQTWLKYPFGCQKQELDKIGTAILKGQIGVAENGAIWLDESNFPDRLVPFIAEVLIIRLNNEDLVMTMPEVYNKPGTGNSGFGVFISGPSKTADIEQSLVYGAHGAKEMIVVIS